LPQDSQTTARRTLIGICTLNEAANIVPLMAALRESIPDADVLVVDDNSADNTASLVSQRMNDDQQIRLIVRKNERGLGSAIRRAMQEAVEHDYEFFINLDGDFSHDPTQVPALLKLAVQSPDVDVVIGSRYVDGGSIVGWPLHRRWMSRIVNRFAKVCLRLPVNDCSGSMRCYRVSALKKLGLENVRSNGYAVLEELLVQMHRQGAELAEVPITFTDRARGKSKLTLREALRSTWQIIAMARR
jgi:dolichol-phosphate mannosyltransferase